MITTTTQTTENLIPSPSKLDSKQVYTISELNQFARITLEKNIGSLWISGEISNFSQPSSGHCYFSLKDNKAQVRCALFRSTFSKLKFKPQNGQQVIAYAQLSLYEARGDYQLIIYQMNLSGEGELQIAFEELKKRLLAAGLFDNKFKKPIPRFPKTIGVITSSTGAAIRDILTVLKNRFPSIPVIIYPTLVQGKTAGPQIAKAIHISNQRQETNVLILARGGGSLEDLWAFNEEVVARAIFNSELPIVTGIGHEIDFTIADFVADLRGATPSAAAAQVSPDQTEIKIQLQQLSAQLLKNTSFNIQQHKHQLRHLQQRLQHPGQKLQQQMQQLDQLDQRLNRAIQDLLSKYNTKLKEFSLNLRVHNPEKMIHQHKLRIDNYQKQLDSRIIYYLDKYRQKLKHLSHTLNTISPLTLLDRGFSIAQKVTNKEIVSSSEQVKEGDSVILRLAKGQLLCNVLEKL